MGFGPLKLNLRVVCAFENLEFASRGPLPSNFELLMGLGLQIWNCDLCSFKFGILSDLDGKTCSVKLSWPQGFVHHTVTIVVVLKFPGHRVLFIPQSHNSK